jgi:hypothetical protein
MWSAVAGRVRWLTYILILCSSFLGDGVVAPVRADGVVRAGLDGPRCRLPGGGYRSTPQCDMTLARHLHLRDHAHALEGRGRNRTTNVLALRKRYDPLGADHIGLEEHHHAASKEEARDTTNHIHGAFESPSGEEDLPGVIPGNEASAGLEFRFFKGSRDRIAAARQWRKRIRERAVLQQHVGVLGIPRELYGVEINGEKLSTRKQKFTARYKRQVADRGGVIILNHPSDFFARNLEYSIPFEQARLFDGVEVFNDVGPRRYGTNAAMTLAWTEANFFQRGIFPAVVSGHDDHGPRTRSMRGPRWPSMLKILTPDGIATEKAALAGIRERATYVVQRPTLNNKEHKHREDFAPETTMELAVDGRIGLGAQNLAFRSGSRHRLEVHLDNLPPFSKVELVYNGRTVRAVQAPHGGRVSATATFAAEVGAVHPRTKQRFGYVYAKVTVAKRPNVPARLQKHFRDRLYLCTSPVPFVVHGSRRR